MRHNCRYNKQCCNPECKYNHSYEFVLPQYNAQQPNNTVLLPCHRPDWLYIQRALNSIETVEECQSYFKSVLYNSHVKFLPTLTTEEKQEFVTSFLPMIKQMINEHQQILNTNIEYIIKPKTVQLTRKQCVCLLSCFTMGLYANEFFRIKNFNTIVNFIYFLIENNRKFDTQARCLMNYFRNVVRNIGNEEFMNEIVTFAKHSSRLTKQQLLNCQNRLIIPIVDNDNGIMSFTQERNWKGDFANRFIGGGVFGHGAVQEEIMFMEAPECYIAMFLCSRMENDETIRMENIVRCSQIDGYNRSVSYGRDIGINEKHNIVAFDAIVNTYRRKQYEEDMCLRDMGKLYSAINVYSPTEELLPIVSGNWGCGAFGGDWRWKYVQHLLVCSFVGRPFIFTTWHNQKEYDEILAFQERIKQDPPTVGNAFQWILNEIRCHREDELLISESFPSFTHPFESNEISMEEKSASASGFGH